MAEVFRKAGYATFGFSAIPFTGKMTNLHQGYEQFREAELRSAAASLRPAHGEGGARVRRRAAALARASSRRAVLRGAPRRGSAQPVRGAAALRRPTWARSRPTRRATAQLLEQVRPKIDHPLMQVFGMPARVRISTRPASTPSSSCATSTTPTTRSIRSTDVEVARVVERLDQLGLRDRVLLAFTSDHGTEFLDHGKHFHGHTVYGELNRVPMFFWGPSYVPAGRAHPDHGAEPRLHADGARSRRPRASRSGAGPESAPVVRRQRQESERRRQGLETRAGDHREGVCRGCAIRSALPRTRS